MKLSAIAVLALPALASAFAPSSVSRPAFASSLSMAGPKTGPEGKAATSKEEDMDLTYQVIMDHIEAELGPSEEPAEASAEEEE